jgi:hypothetical protein
MFVWCQKGRKWEGYDHFTVDRVCFAVKTTRASNKARGNVTSNIATANENAHWCHCSFACHSVEDIKYDKEQKAAIAEMLATGDIPDHVAAQLMEKLNAELSGATLI